MVHMVDHTVTLQNVWGISGFNTWWYTLHDKVTRVEIMLCIVNPVSRLCSCTLIMVLYIFHLHTKVKSALLLWKLKLMVTEHSKNTILDSTGRRMNSHKPFKIRIRGVQKLGYFWLRQYHASQRYVAPFWRPARAFHPGHCVVRGSDSERGAELEISTIQPCSKLWWTSRRKQRPRHASVLVPLRCRCHCRCAATAAATAASPLVQPRFYLHRATKSRVHHVFGRIGACPTVRAGPPFHTSPFAWQLVIGIIFFVYSSL